MDRCVRFNRPVFQNILKNNASALHGQIDFMFCDMKQFKIVRTISYSAVEINFKLWIIKLEPAIAYVAKEIEQFLDQALYQTSFRCESYPECSPQSLVF